MITLMSWGHKYGQPPANFKFDVSYLKNPWRVPELKDAPMSKILEYLEEQEEFTEIIESIAIVASTYERFYPGENHVFAICCSAGEYRSPIVAERVKSYLEIKYGVDGDSIKLIQSKNAKI